jgi:environmental stress-induced protein Ves
LRGLDRQFMVIEGAGVELTSIDDSGKTRQARALPMQAPYPFHGDWKTDCRLLGGPVRVLNVVTRRGQFYADVDYSEDVVLVKPAGETLVAVQPASLEAWMLSGPQETTWQTPTPDEHLVVVRITAIKR